MTYYTPPPKKKRPHPALIVVIVGLVVLGAVCCGIGLATSKSSTEKEPAPVATTAAVQSPAAPVKTEAVKTEAPKAPTITDGTWTVGEDFPAGTYKTAGSTGSCYWAIYTSGKNQSFDSLIDNHSGGGNLRVTLKAGQDFETKRCGTWTKV